MSPVLFNSLMLSFRGWITKMQSQSKSRESLGIKSTVNELFFAVIWTILLYVRFAPNDFGSLATINQRDFNIIEFSQISGSNRLILFCVSQIVHISVHVKNKSTEGIVIIVIVLIIDHEFEVEFDLTTAV